MSYISQPRLSFSGQFQADVSTAKNDVCQFDNSGSGSESPGAHSSDAFNGWNPDGSSTFRLIDLTVKSAVTPSSSTETDSATGLYLTTNSQCTSAKLVELDPQFQMGSALWGLGIVLTDGVQEIMRADYLPAAFRDINFARGDKQLSAKFTSILTNVSWSKEVGSSQVLTELREQALLNKNRLSINLLTFGFSLANFTGNVVGSIGTWTEGQPERFVLGRRFAVATAGQTTTPEGIGFFDAEVTDTVSLDLGNALPLASSAGDDLVDLQSISAVVLKTADETTESTSQSDSVMAGIIQGQEIDSTEFELLGEVPYRDKDWLLNTAGIVDFMIPANATELVHDRPLALVRPSETPGKFKVLIRETIGGLFVRADQFEFRVDSLTNKDVIVDATLYTARYGKPVGGYAVDLSLGAPEPGPGGCRPNPPTTAKIPVIGHPAEALAFTSQVVTDVDGRVNFPVKVSDPGNPREYFDGQIYKIAYNFSMDGTSPLPLIETFVLHVRDAYIPPENPSWSDHVEPIIRHYGNLYPIMTKGLFSVNDSQAIEKHAKLLKFAFERPPADPNHMPETRDLSSGKRQTILSYLDHHIAGEKPPVFTALSKHRVADAYAPDQVPNVAVLMSVASAQEVLINVKR